MEITEFPHPRLKTRDVIIFIKGRAEIKNASQTTSSVQSDFFSGKSVSVLATARCTSILCRLALKALLVNTLVQVRVCGCA